MKQSAEIIERFVQDFKDFEAGLNGAKKSAIHSLRSAAINRFRELGFPSLHHEEWRYTNINPIIGTRFQRAGKTIATVTRQDILSLLPFLEDERYALVFINGRRSEEHSRISDSGDEGLIVEDLASALANRESLISQHIDKAYSEAKNVFAELNTAFMTDGAFIYIPKNLIIAEPIHLVFLTDVTEPTVFYPRILVIAEESSSCAIVESYASLSNRVSFTNAVTEIHLGENARVEHYKLQTESERAYHIGNMMVAQERDSVCASSVLSFGSAIARNDVNVLLNAEGCENALNGLYLVNGTRHVDSHTLIDHAKPNCKSRELYKGILDDSGRGVFSGRIIVRKDAQKTDAKQSNKNLLLSESATIDSKPQLEILADDVKCTHGATIGRLEDDAIFYLRSRGIGEKEAEGILTLAFANEVVEGVKDGKLKEYLAAMITARLHKNGATEV